MAFKILVGSTCDISVELMEKHDICCAAMGGIMSDEDYKHHPDYREMSREEFFARLRAGESTGTSAINIDEWEELMRAGVEECGEVLVLAFSSALSSTYHNAVLAAEEITEKTGAKIIVIDTLCASLGETLIAVEAAKMRAMGKTLDETASAVSNMLMNVAHWFTVDDLAHLYRGGRISGASAVVGSALGIKPVLHIDDKGTIVNVSKVRGQKKSVRALLEKAQELAIRPVGEMYIGHADCEAYAESLASMLKPEFPEANINILSLGPIIASHLGPDSLALFFMAESR